MFAKYHQPIFFNLFIKTLLTSRLWRVYRSSCCVCSSSGPTIEPPPLRWVVWTLPHCSSMIWCFCAGYWWAVRAKTATVWCLTPCLEEQNITILCLHGFRSLEMTSYPLLNTLWRHRHFLLSRFEKTNIQEQSKEEIASQRCVIVQNNHMPKFY